MYRLWSSDDAQHFPFLDNYTIGGSARESLGAVVEVKNIRAHHKREYFLRNNEIGTACDGVI